jgi:cytochrome oxidase Cu insertion factor (SCO1/SenC/PrrC family)
VADRVTRDTSDRRSGALIALAAIIAITAAWWALALWPAGDAEPLWLQRTRVACFGSRPGGLPDAGGWILLIGEPLGMLGMLMALWGRSLRRDIQRLYERRAVRFAAVGVAMIALPTSVVLVSHVAQAWDRARAAAVDVLGAPQRIDRAPPAVTLVDQLGRRTAFGDFRDQVVLIAFAYGHCATVCPAVVNDLRAARHVAGLPNVPLVVITIDPWRDTPERLQTLAQHWGLGPGDRVLSGSVVDVETALDGLGVSRRRNETTGDVDHVTTVMILDEHGRLAWRIDGAPTAIPTLLRAERQRVRG